MNKREWGKLSNRFESSVCDIVAADSRDLLGHLLDQAGFVKCRGAAIDAGCGVGTFVGRHAARFENVLAFDFVEGFVARAQSRLGERYPHVLWLCDNIGEISKHFQQDFDCVVSLNVLTHANAWTRRAHWQAVCSLARSGGTLLVVVPSTESHERTHSIIVRRNLGRGDKVSGGIVRRSGTRQKTYTEAELIGLTKHFGFAAHVVRRISYPWAYDGVQRANPVTDHRPWDWVCWATKAY